MRSKFLVLLAIGCATSEPAPPADPALAPVSPAALAEVDREPTLEEVHGLARALGCPEGAETEKGCDRRIGLGEAHNPMAGHVQTAPTVLDVRLGRYHEGGELGALVRLPNSVFFVMAYRDEGWVPVDRFDGWRIDYCRNVRQVDGLDYIACIVPRPANDREGVFHLRAPDGATETVAIPWAKPGLGPGAVQIQESDLTEHDVPRLRFEVHHTKLVLLLAPDGPRVEDGSHPRTRGFELGVQASLTNRIPPTLLHDHPPFWVGDLRVDPISGEVLGRLFPAKAPHAEDAEDFDEVEPPEPPEPYLVLKDQRWVADASDGARPERHAQLRPCPFPRGEGFPDFERSRSVYAMASKLCVIYGIIEGKAHTFTWDGERLEQISGEGPGVYASVRLAANPYMDRVVLLGVTDEREVVATLGYDQELQREILVAPRDGSDEPTPPAETWLLERGTWRRLGGELPRVGPDSALYFDIASQEFQAIGRAGWSTADGVGLGEPQLWGLHGQDWQPRPTRGTPPPYWLSMEGAVYSNVGSQLIAAGGVPRVNPANPTTMSKDETWGLHRGTWRNLARGVAFSKSHHQLVHDSHRDRFILLDKGVWEAGRQGPWEELAAGSGPQRYVVASYFPDRRYTLVVQPQSGEMWSWDGEIWQKLQARFDSPDGPTTTRLAYRADVGKVYILGGGSTRLSDSADDEPRGPRLWSFDGDRLEQVAAQADFQRQINGFAWHPGESRFYALVEGDTWVFEPSDGRWSKLAERQRTAPRAGNGSTTPALFYHTGIEAMVAAPRPGFPYYRVFADGAWHGIQLSDQELSCQVSNSSTAPAWVGGVALGEGVAAAFDPVRESLVLHGGSIYSEGQDGYIGLDAFCELRLTKD